MGAREKKSFWAAAAEKKIFCLLPKGTQNRMEGRRIHHPKTAAKIGFRPRRKRENAALFCQATATTVEYHQDQPLHPHPRLHLPHSAVVRKRPLLPPHIAQKNSGTSSYLIRQGRKSGVGRRKEERCLACIIHPDLRSNVASTQDAFFASFRTVLRRELSFRRLGPTFPR